MTSATTTPGSRQNRGTKQRVSLGEQGAPVSLQLHAVVVDCPSASMYVCMHACMHACPFVSPRMQALTRQAPQWVQPRQGIRMCMYVCEGGGSAQPGLYVCMYLCMYVCVFVCIHACCVDVYLDV